MTVTKRFVILEAVGIIALIPAALSGSAAVMAAVFFAYNLTLMGLLAADCYTSRGVSKIILTRDKEDKLYFKTENFINLYARNDLDYPVALKLKDSLPGRHFKLTGAGVMSGVVRPGEEKNFNYEVIPTKRGAFFFPAIYAYRVGRMGLCRVYLSCAAPMEYKVYPNVRDLSKFRLMTQNKRLIPQGERITRLRGPGSEFESLREYVEGDDIRKINWMATAREGKIIVNQYRTERNQPVFILIDAGRPMGYSVKGYKKLDYAINACLTLADTVNQQGDNSGIMVFDTSARTMIMPGKGDVHRGRIMEALYHIEDTRDTPDYESAFLELISKQKRHSLVFIFTDFETPEQAGELARNVMIIKKRHAPFIILIENESLKRMRDEPGCADSLYEKAAAAEFLRSRRDLIRDMNSRGVSCVECPAENFTVTAINQYLMAKR